MAPSNNPNWPANASEIDKILELLKEGKETIQLDERYRNVTLVFGTTGSGQSTFVQWLAGDGTKLIAELVPHTLNEFIVKDDSSTGNSTIQSIVPELVVDPVTDLAYYDCPKFAQSASTDIVGTYFTKAVADYAENVRLIFTVPYSAVKVGMDRITFPELLKHSTDLVKNVDKYRNSIALVATNVDNTVYQNENGQLVNITDEQIIDSIANFLKIVREELKRDTTTETHRNYIKFIDALLQRDGQAYSKIGIFRRPNMPGPLSEMASLQQSKTKLVEKVKQLELIPIEADDFGYSFSGKTKNVAYKLVSTLNHRVLQDADIIAQEMAQMYQLLSVEEIRFRIWTAMKADFSKMRNVEQFATLLGESLNYPNLSENDLIKSAILSLFNSGKYLNYLSHAIHDHPVHTRSSVRFSETGSVSPGNMDWSRFLNGLYSKLGEYQFQQNSRQYNVANLEDWGEGETKPQNIHIDERNFSQFLHKLNQHNISGLGALKDTQIAQWQLDELNQVLSSTLKHGDAKLDCIEDGKLVVTGDYVKLSELKPRLVDICPSRINSVNIFASNTLFIDSDLDGLGSQLQLTLSAPKWEVVGQRRINLDGSAGAAPNPPKARNSDHAGINPEKGRPGQFGGHAGSFLGLAQQFVNREGLTVTANGGAGGDGQEGGDGHDGERGNDAPVPYEGCHINAPYEVTWTKTEMHGFTQYNYTDYRIYGSSGTEGGVGGDGGAGGTGGRQGVIDLYNLDGSNKQKIDTKPGSDGSGGRGGIGGYDGLHGNDLAAHCEFYFTWGFWTRKYMSSEPITYDHRNRAANGRDGANHDQNVRLSEVVSLNWHSTNAISEFKNFLRSKLNDVNDRFMGLSAIVDQLGKIERKFGSLENGGLSHSTDSLLSQINKYAEALQPTRDLDHIMKKYNYLTQVNKLYNLSSSPEPNMIFDVDGFLYYVQEIIDILNKLRNQQQGPVHEIVQQQLDNLIANIKTDHLVDSADPQLLVVAKELETLIRSSFVLQQYDSVVVALKQLVFPYAQFYVDETGFNRDSTDIEYLVNSAVASLSKMRSRVLENRSSIWQVDQYVHRANFDSSQVVANPFHVWTNVENRNAIGQLLSGESVVLNADIRASDSDKDAIKFSLLEINLKAKDSTAQAEINAQLGNFLVSATQLGNSNYRYGDKYYQINNIPLSIEYSFAKDSNGQPIVHNEVYRKIKSGDLMASPYAMWQIQLSKMNELVSFDRLAKYVDAVDLELVGQGIYTESQRARSDYLQVDRYYSEYVDQSNVTERQQLNSAKVRKVSNSLHRSQDRLPNQAINSSGQLSYMSRFGETVSNLFGSTVKTRHIAHPRFDYTKQERNANSNTNSMTQSSNSLDVQGNLLLGQLLVGLIAGKNGTLSSDSFMSPEKAREVQVKSLAQRIVPALSQPSATRSSQLYNSNIQWHRDWNATSRELHN